MLGAASGGAGEIHEAHPTAAEVEFVNGVDGTVGVFFVVGMPWVWMKSRPVLLFSNTRRTANATNEASSTVAQLRVTPGV